MSTPELYSSPKLRKRGVWAVPVVGKEDPHAGQGREVSPIPGSISIWVLKTYETQERPGFEDVQLL